MGDVMNQPVNPYPLPTEKLEDREGYPFAVPFPVINIFEPADDQLALALNPVPERKVPRFDGDR